MAPGYWTLSFRAMPGEHSEGTRFVNAEFYNGRD